MEKRSSNVGNSKQRVEVTEQPVTEVAPKTVRLVLNKNVKLKIRGSASGKEYFFDGAGTVLEIDERDVEEFLQKGVRRGCCGSTPSPYFSVLGGY